MNRAPSAFSAVLFLSRTISHSLYSKSQRHLVFENTMTTPGDGVEYRSEKGVDGNKLVVSIVAVPAEERPERSQPKKRQTVSIAAPPHSSSEGSKKSRLVLLMVLMEAATLETEMAPPHPADTPGNVF